MIKKLMEGFRIAYHLQQSEAHRENLLWEYLKQYHAEEKFNSGIYESEKRIETDFQITDNFHLRFVYVLNDGRFICNCRILEGFDSELTTDMFVLATHFNNLLRRGKIVVNPDQRAVDYNLESDYITNIVFRENIKHNTLIHYSTTRDAVWAYAKLTQEREEPAIIIADLVRMNKEAENNETQS